MSRQEQNEGEQRRRAQLLGLYFQMRALPDPPSYLARAEDRLRRELEEGGASFTAEPRLRVVD
jgi:hypothetical protein